MIESMEVRTWARIGTVAQRLDVSEGEVRALVRKRVLPPPVRLGRKCSVWDWSAVVEAMEKVPSAQG